MKPGILSSWRVRVAGVVVIAVVIAMIGFGTFAVAGGGPEGAKTPPPVGTPAVPQPGDPGSPVRVPDPDSKPLVDAPPAPAPQKPTPSPERDQAGVAIIWPGAVKGEGTYRIGMSDWYLSVPAGVPLRFAGGSINDPGGQLLSFVDERTGSELLIDADTGEEFGRNLTADRAVDLSDEAFDSIASSFRKTP